MQPRSKQAGQQFAFVNEQRQPADGAKMGEDEQVYGQPVAVPGQKMHSQRQAQPQQESNLLYGDLPVYQAAEVDERVYEQAIASPRGKLMQEGGGHDFYKEFQGVSGANSGLNQK